MCMLCFVACTAAGIPLNYVDRDPSKGLQYPRRRTVFTMYADESDNGTYPFPLNASIEGAYPGCPPSSCSGDRHVLALDNFTCTLWEAANCVAPSSLTGERQHSLRRKAASLPLSHTAWWYLQNIVISSGDSLGTNKCTLADSSRGNEMGDW
jgi:hypothetical protein